MKTTKLIILALILTISFTGISKAENTELVKKKGKLWLIPVLAGAGFAAGTYLGLNAFDQSINSDEKVWTTAAVFSVGGGIAGWLIGRPRAEHIQSYGLPDNKFEIRRLDEREIAWNANDLDLNTILSDRFSALRSRAR